MLLIAIPKSASTALMETVAAAHRMRCDMHMRWPGEQSKEFPAFHRQHNFGWELDPQTIEVLTSSAVLHKSHILPSSNNQALLRERKKAVLLREPLGIIGAYKRGEETGVYRQKTNAFYGCVSEDDWLKRAQEVGIFQDLSAFCARWQDHDGEKLVIHYEQMIANPAVEIARLERYFGLPLSGTEALLKRKYTRLGAKSLDFTRRRKICGARRRRRRTSRKTVRR